MNAVEIEEAISRLAESPFDPAEFPFAFLEAFGNKATTDQTAEKSEQRFDESVGFGWGTPAQ